MAIGPFITNGASLNAAQTVTASTALVTMTGFTQNLAATQKMHFRIFVPFNLGATGGYKFQVVLSQTPALFVNTFTVTDTVTPATIVGYQTSSAAFANALAVAGNHFLQAERHVVGHATLASALSFQFACNSAANAIVAGVGAFIQTWFTS
jgi:hypothetical protein